MTSPLLSVERVFPVSIERLWSAWTDASELEEWYSPAVLFVVPGTVVSDARDDGMWKVAVDVPDNGFVAYFWGRYTAVEAPVFFEHTLHYSQDEAEFVLADESGPKHRIVVDFAEHEDGSWVRLTQYGEMPDPDQVEATRLGTESYFDSLGFYLSRTVV